MNVETFNLLVEDINQRCRRVLDEKAKQYATDSTQDRLTQFHRAAAAQGINPYEALMGMMTKHYTAIADMVKDPYNFSWALWTERFTDLHNYFYLLEALTADDSGEWVDDAL